MKLALWAASSLLVLSGALLVLVFMRFHFSNQDFSLLARLQRNHSASNCPEAPRQGRSAAISTFQLIGHQGSGLKVPGSERIIGNTANAIRRGIDAGVDWVEIDIRRTRDGHLVVFHDRTIDVRTNGKGAVAELTLAELLEFNVLVEPSEKILTLEQVIEKFHPEHSRWILDIKEVGIAAQLLPLIAAHFSEDQVILFGTYEVLQEYKHRGYQLGYTVLWGDFGNRMRALFRPSLIIDSARNLGCDYLVLPIIFSRQSLVDEAKSHGFSVWTYGSEDECDWGHAADRGITGLIVDQPERAVNFSRPAPGP